METEHFLPTEETRQLYLCVSCYLEFAFFQSEWMSRAIISTRSYFLLLHTPRENLSNATMKSTSKFTSEETRVHLNYQKQRFRANSREFKADELSSPPNTWAKLSSYKIKVVKQSYVYSELKHFLKNVPNWLRFCNKVGWIIKSASIMLHLANVVKSSMSLQSYTHLPGCNSPWSQDLVLRKYVLPAAEIIIILMGSENASLYTAEGKAQIWFHVSVKYAAHTYMSVINCQSSLVVTLQEQGGFHFICAFANSQLIIL